MEEEMTPVHELVGEFGSIDVELVGLDGNAFSIMGALTRQAKRQGWPTWAQDTLRSQMMAGDYDNLLRVAMVAVGDLD